MSENKQQVVFVDSKIAALKGNGRTTLLLKAMDLAKNPEKMKQMMGVKTVAEVYRTLDKLTLRRSYHQALASFDIDFNYIVKGLKELGDTANDKVRLGVMQTLLRSMGMDKYDVTEVGSGGDWEEILMKKAEEDKEVKALAPSAEQEIEEYEVFAPVMPKELAEKKAEEKQIGEGLYSKNLYEG
jgi:hypothetical protein